MEQVGDRDLLEIEALRFGWPGSASQCIAIDRLSIAPGDTLFLHGPSGSGKSTLLSLMAGVLAGDEGHVRLLGQDWKALGDAARDRHRVDHVGYIFQQFNLLPYLSVIDNVLLPCGFSKLRKLRAASSGDASSAAASLLDRMGIGAALLRQPAMRLSVGQQQRVAAARALIGRPELVIADEPTSALDHELRDAFLDVLLEACGEHRSALVFVSHDRQLAGRFQRQLSLAEINVSASPSAPPAPPAPGEPGERAPHRAAAA
ncbi:Methionine ABC transporter ATP-binding protein [Burkholderiales bacterium 8X]|nr:Methionine ABC transporter ATP-binding protein [Burkholderiales bacterium 8X]